MTELVFRRALACSALLLFFAGPLVAQTRYPAAELGMCPDATEEESKMFRPFSVDPPEIRDRDRFFLQGSEAMMEAHRTDTFAEIPKAWERLLEGLPNIGNAKRPVGQPPTAAPPYAACFTVAGQPAFRFVPAVEVDNLENVLPGMVGVEMPPNKYAVFQFSGDVNATGDFRFAANNYLAAQNIARLDDPNFEFYRSMSEAGPAKVTMEFWIPVE